MIAVIMRGSNKASGFSCCFAEIKVKSAFAAIGLSAGFSECFGLEVIYLELKAKSSVCPGFSFKNKQPHFEHQKHTWMSDRSRLLFIYLKYQ